MKKIFLLASAAFLFAACCSIPQKVQDSFASAYPNATEVEWECDDQDYEVSYVIDGVRYETEYDKNGNVKATDDPQPKACTGAHKHGDCKGEKKGDCAHPADSCAHKHADCKGLKKGDCTHPADSCAHKHGDCKGEKKGDCAHPADSCAKAKTECTGDHQNCQNKK